MFISLEIHEKRNTYTGKSFFSAISTYVQYKYSNLNGLGVNVEYLFNWSRRQRINDKDIYAL